ncbi:MAG: hypothetical protein ACRCW2_01095 [Cellulosilyticaceae bacterium]
MRRYKEISYTLAMVISIVVGIWHFCVPYLYSWYDYLPGIPDILRVSIDWINFFFSLFLVGYSVLLLLVRKEFFERNRVVYLFYNFFVVIWICRVGITIVHNWGWNIMVMGYLIAFSVELMLLLIPLIKVNVKESSESV